jgi:hypothetical protein
MPRSGLFLQLLDGNENREHEFNGEGRNGPVFGPFAFVELAQGGVIKLGVEESHYELTFINQRSIYYGGIYYGQAGVFFARSKSELGRHQRFDQAKAIPPTPA